MVGFIGFFQLLLYVQIGQFWGLGHRSGRSSIELIVLGIIVAIGLVKAFISLYGLVKSQAQKILFKVENMILEVEE